MTPEAGVREPTCCQQREMTAVIWEVSTPKSEVEAVRETRNLSSKVLTLETFLVDLWIDPGRET